jgi:hypothetical protein
MILAVHLLLGLSGRNTRDHAVISSPKQNTVFIMSQLETEHLRDDESRSHTRLRDFSLSMGEVGIELRAAHEADTGVSRASRDTLGLRTEIVEHYKGRTWSQHNMNTRIWINRPNTCNV